MGSQTVGHQQKGTEMRKVLQVFMWGLNVNFSEQVNLQIQNR